MKTLILSFIILINLNSIAQQTYCGLTFMTDEYKMAVMPSRFYDKDVNIDIGSSTDDVTVTSSTSKERIFLEFGCIYNGCKRGQLQGFLITRTSKSQSVSLYTSAKLQFGKPDEGFEQECWQIGHDGTYQNRLKNNCLIYRNVYKQGDVVVVTYKIKSDGVSGPINNLTSHIQHSIDISYRGDTDDWNKPKPTSYVSQFKTEWETKLL